LAVRRVTNPFQAIRTWFDRLRSRRLRSEALHHDGTLRSYLLYVPLHAPPGAALPLVIALHGGGGRPIDMARITALHRVAERETFIVAYPAGTATRRRGYIWNAGGRVMRGPADDVGFIAALIETLRRDHRIDPARIYVAGLSLGGSMAYRLACALSDRIAAVAVVAGTMVTADCRPVQPVSVIHIHGTADQRVPLEGGRGRFTAAHNNWPPVMRGIEQWRAINGCVEPAEIVRLVEGLVGHRWSGNADVELGLVEGGRHVWPGGRRQRWWRASAPRAAFSASDKVWKYFADHPRAQS
jgi:polyhydroxybutyrate depolymerase